MIFAIQIYKLEKYLFLLEDVFEIYTSNTIIEIQLI